MAISGKKTTNTTDVGDMVRDQKGGPCGRKRMWIFLILGVLLLVLGLVIGGIYLNVRSLTSSLQNTEVLPTYVPVATVLVTGVLVLLLFWKRPHLLVLVTSVVSVGVGVLCGVTASLTGTHIMRPIAHYVQCSMYEARSECHCLSPYNRHSLDLQYSEQSLATYVYVGVESCNAVQLDLVHMLYALCIVYGIIFVTSFVVAVLALLAHRTERLLKKSLEDDSCEAIFTVSNTSSASSDVEAEQHVVLQPTLNSTQGETTAADLIYSPADIPLDYNEACRMRRSHSFSQPRLRNQSIDSTESNTAYASSTLGRGDSHRKSEGRGKLKEHRQRSRRAVTLHNLDTQQLMLILSLQMRYLQENHETDKQNAQLNMKKVESRALLGVPPTSTQGRGSKCHVSGDSDLKIVHSPTPQPQPQHIVKPGSVQSLASSLHYEGPGPNGILPVVPYENVDLCKVVDRRKHLANGFKSTDANRHKIQNAKAPGSDFHEWRSHSAAGQLQRGQSAVDQEQGSWSLTGEEQRSQSLSGEVHRSQSMASEEQRSQSMAGKDRRAFGAAGHHIPSGQLTQALFGTPSSGPKNTSLSSGTLTQVNSYEDIDDVSSNSVQPSMTQIHLFENRAAASVVRVRKRRPTIDSVDSTSASERSDCDMPPRPKSYINAIEGVKPVLCLEESDNANNPPVRDLSKSPHTNVAASVYQMRVPSQNYASCLATALSRQYTVDPPQSRQHTVDQNFDTANGSQIDIYAKPQKNGSGLQSKPLSVPYTHTSPCPLPGEKFLSPHKSPYPPSGEMVAYSGTSPHPLTGKMIPFTCTSPYSLPGESSSHRSAFHKVGRTPQATNSSACDTDLDDLDPVPSQRSRRKPSKPAKYSLPSYEFLAASHQNSNHSLTSSSSHTTDDLDNDLYKQITKKGSSEKKREITKINQDDRLTHCNQTLPSRLTNSGSNCSLTLPSWHVNGGSSSCNQTHPNCHASSDSNCKLMHPTWHTNNGSMQKAGDLRGQQYHYANQVFPPRRHAEDWLSYAQGDHSESHSHPVRQHRPHTSKIPVTPVQQKLARSYENLDDVFEPLSCVDPTIFASQGHRVRENQFDINSNRVQYEGVYHLACGTEESDSEFTETVI